MPCRLTTIQGMEHSDGSCSHGSGRCCSNASAAGGRDVQQCSRMMLQGQGALVTAVPLPVSHLSSPPAHLKWHPLLLQLSPRLHPFGTIRRVMPMAPQAVAFALHLVFVCFKVSRTSRQVIKMSLANSLSCETEPNISPPGLNDVYTLKAASVVVSSPWLLHHDSKACRACSTYFIPFGLKEGPYLYNCFFLH